MPKKAKELSALEVKRLRHGTIKGSQAASRPAETPCIAYHAVGGVSGLMLQCRPPAGDAEIGARSWILRTMVAGKRRDIGLGGYPEVTLAQARENAREIKEKIRQGIDPVAERKSRKEALKREQGKLVTFGQLADEYLAMKAKEFSGKNKGKQLQKVSTQLYRYAYPTLKDMLVGDIRINHVESILTPIWLTKHTTANDVRIHIERVMDRAITRDLCRNRNPASLKALQGLLPTPRGKKAFKSTHRPALPVKDLPRFHAQLMGNGTLGSHALAFQILTATRPGEARYAKWDDIDFDNRVWYVPAEDMKQGEAHEVPLSEPAIRILETMGRQGQYIFSNDGKKPISENTANIRIKAIHRKDLENGEPGFLDPLQDKIATAHGFRSTFKDWTIEFTQYRDELSEAALAHQVGDDTRNAYARSKQTEQRRPMMEDWAAYCLSLLEQESSSELPACA